MFATTYDIKETKEMRRELLLYKNEHQNPFFTSAIELSLNAETRGEGARHCIEW